MGTTIGLVARRYQWVYALAAVSTLRSTAPAGTLYRFGPYEVDTARNELRKFELRIKLERKPLQILIALLGRAGQVVTRTDLQHFLWGDEVFVDFEKGLTVAVTKLRAALSDSAERPTYIETVAGGGYRFIGKVEQVFALPPSPAEAGQIALRPIAVPDQVRGWLPQVKLRESRVSNRWVFFAVFIVCAFLFLAGATLLWRRLAYPETARARKIMLVVLPFENLSGDPGQEFLSDGMTEELSERLGNLNPDRLGVIGRTSAMTYKHVPRSISQIGKELGVGYVLEGSVRRNGNKFRVTAQLVEVSDQAHVWAQNYDRELRDLLQVEEDIASEISRQIGVSIALGAPAIPLLHTPNAEAHEAYLLGRYYWYKRTPEGWKTAQQYFRRAIEEDPEYGAAYAGLAESLIPRKEALAAAKKAAELEPTSAEAQTALGWVDFFAEWDFVAAAEALKTAIRLDPNYGRAHHIYSGVLQLSGHFQESIDEQKQAVLLDPLSLVFRGALADGYSAAGRNDQAQEEINRIFAIDPKYPKGHETLGNVYLRKGMYKEAISEYEASELNGGAKLLGLRGYAYARAGERDQALRNLSELQELERRSPSGDVSSDLATVEIGLGNREAALASLEKEYEQHDSDGPWEAKVDPIFVPLRSDPRFQELMRRVKFPE
jgi:TolB-like protein/DNA-binding winged helix-turn-helix (wHTH) protein/Tfp pilus assembly protein PilF